MVQGVVKGIDVPHNQRFRGTDTFQVICYADIPVDRLKEIINTKVVCEVCPYKADPHRMRITIEGNIIFYHGDIGTPTGYLYLIKLIINRVASQCNVQFIKFDIKKFYLEAPM